LNKIPGSIAGTIAQWKSQEPDKKEARALLPAWGREAAQEGDVQTFIIILISCHFCKDSDEKGPCFEEVRFFCQSTYSALILLQAPII
jgi:hypothetical protein